MMILGIIGTPAGGKSTVAKKLVELGATWIDADRIAHRVLESEPVQQQVIRYFGPTITHSDGRINRSLLATAVFGDDEATRQALRYLESVLHPPTRKEITSQLIHASRNGFSVAVLDVPLLLESNWDVCCDEVWSIDSPLADRIERSSRRGWDAGELARRESNQLAISEKNRLSNHQIMNDSTLVDLHQKVIEHWNRLTSRQSDSETGFSIRHCLTDRSPALGR